MGEIIMEKRIKEFVVEETVDHAVQVVVDGIVHVAEAVLEPEDAAFFLTELDKWFEVKNDLLERDSSDA
jgi:uncharacterized protein (DUF1778 family)